MAEMPRPHDAQKVAAQQRHTRAFDGDIGSRAHRDADVSGGERGGVVDPVAGHRDDPALFAQPLHDRTLLVGEDRSEEHTSELQSLMRISYAVFCLKQKTKHTYQSNYNTLNPKIHESNT